MGHRLIEDEIERQENERDARMNAVTQLTERKEFLYKSNMKKEDKEIVYFGLDPGKDGHLTAFTEKGGYKFYPMPEHKVPSGKLLKSGKPQMKTEFHLSGLANLAWEIACDFPLSVYSLVAGIEEVGGRGGWGATQNFSFGHIAGMQRMIFEMLSAEIIMVRPQKWQSFVRKGYTLIKNPSSSGKTMVVDSKAMAEQICVSEFPNIDFRKTERATKNHDGKCDSFLICNYIKKTYKNN